MLLQVRGVEVVAAHEHEDGGRLGGVDHGGGALGAGDAVGLLGVDGADGFEQVDAQEQVGLAVGD